jgi:hypothetical protein
VRQAGVGQKLPFTVNNSGCKEKRDSRQVATDTMSQKIQALDIKARVSIPRQSRGL